MGTEISSSPINPILRFLLSSSLFLVIGYGQFVLKKMGSNWLPLKVQEISDLCSITNISIIILDQSLHGYYIHGVAPTGQADGTLEELRKALAMEEAGKTKQRGISEEDKTALQTYEIYIPFLMR